MESAALVASPVFLNQVSVPSATEVLLGLRLARMALGQESLESIEQQDAQALEKLLPAMEPEHRDSAKYTAVCVTAWSDYRRFAVIHPDHSFLAHAHPPSRADLDSPRGYHVKDGKFYRVW